MKSSIQRIRKIRRLRKWLRTQQQLRDEAVYLPAMPPHLLLGELFGVIRRGRKAIRKLVKRVHQSKANAIQFKESNSTSQSA